MPSTGEISCLTFGFSGGVRSPPVNTYNVEPSRPLEIRHDQNVSKIDFNMQNENIYAVLLYSSTGKNIISLIGMEKDGGKVVSVKF